MQKDTYSIEVIGFSDNEQTVLASVFGLSARRTPKFVKHASIEVPDIFLVDSNDEAAIKQLGVRNPVGDVPVVLIGDTSRGTNWTLLPRPIRWMKLFQAFDATIGRALSDSGSAVPAAASAVAPVEASFTQPAQPQEFAKPELLAPAKPAASTVVIPTREALLQKIAETTAKMASFNAAPSATTEWVLVVDDNQTVREFMRNKLAAFSFNVDYAESGEQAIGMTGQKHYSCIFLDVVMPGIDGYQVCKLIKANRSAKKTTVIMLTSKSSPFDKIRGAMSGCDAYLTKPVDEEKLLETIAKFLHTGS